jgi:glutathione synthase/RimK-type ligase-like ATP-grasp enzyme
LVIKPLDLGGGKGIFIDIPEKLKNIPKSFPLLMQEFIDTSAGIPGITTGMHDLRVVLCNGEIIHSNIRTPGKGDKKANFSQGGSLKVIDPELLPEDLKYIVASIDFDLSLYGERLYSLDFGLSADNEWKLIELNARPGMPSIDTEFSFLHEKLADFFARILHS